jgi:hypothetical protein
MHGYPPSPGYGNEAGCASHPICYKKNRQNQRTSILFPFAVILYGKLVCPLYVLRYPGQSCDKFLPNRLGWVERIAQTEANVQVGVLPEGKFERKV